LHMGTAYFALGGISGMVTSSKANGGIFGIGVTRQVEWDMCPAISSNLVVPQDIIER